MRFRSIQHQMKPHIINNSLCENFINGWYFNDTTVCDNLVNFFEENSENAAKGTTGLHGYIDSKRKNSFDIGFDADDNRQILVSYKENLEQALNQYKQKYTMCSEWQSEWGIYEGYNMQKYPIGGGYPSWHYENNGSGILKNRHLVFMTYLNDVTKDGETEFMYQKIKIKPEKGLTLIWPATWEYTHRGNVCADQEKYIITGWYSYKDV
mgnify:FL=1